MPARPVARSAGSRAISTAPSPATPSCEGKGSRRGSSAVTSASARSPRACATRADAIASMIRGFRCPSAATPKPPERSRYSRPPASQTRHPSARAQIIETPLRAVAPGQEPADRVAGDVAGDLRVLLQAAQRVLVPVPAKRDVDPQLVPLLHELVTELRPDAQEHLELVVVVAQTAPAHEPAALVDEPAVVRGDAHVAPGVEERLERPHEARPHRLERAERDLFRLHVDPFAEAHARLEIRERLDVAEGPPEHGLEDDAEVVEALAAQLAIEAKRV